MIHDHDTIESRIGHVLNYRTDPRIVAAWESRGGAYWCYLIHARYGYEYIAPGSGGSVPGAEPSTDADAIAAMEMPSAWFPACRYVDACQPDANKTLMRRIA